MSTKTVEERLRDLESFAFRTRVDMTEIKERLTKLETETPRSVSPHDGIAKADGEG